MKRRIFTLVACLMVISIAILAFDAKVIEAQIIEDGLLIYYSYDADTVKGRDFQRLVDLRPHGQSSQLPFSFSDPKTNFTPGGENCRKYRWSETGRWNTGSNLDDAHQGAETHLDHGRR